MNPASIFSRIKNDWDIGYGIKIKDIKGSTIKDKLINIADEKRLKSQIKKNTKTKKRTFKAALRFDWFRSSI